MLKSMWTLFVVCVAAQLFAVAPVFVPIKIDGPVHDPAKGTFWYGPFSEGSAVFDVDGDGDLDITCGPNWYEGPTFKKHENFRPHATVSGEFINNCGEFPVDVNGDGKMDLISAGWMGNGVYWYENPGKVGVEWKATKVVSSEWTEGLIVEDIDGDDDKDVLINHWSHKEDQAVTWLELVEGGKFEVHVVGTEGDEHGMGLGDLNGDGRKDILTPVGWWEAPEDPAKGSWRFRKDYRLGGGVGIGIIAHDLNGDSLNDLLFGRAHDYGLMWWEQLPPAADGARKFKEHSPIDQETLGESHGQFHTLVLADVNQDGKLDLVTGKRLRGHGDGDASSFDPLNVSWIDIQGGKFAWHFLSYNHLFRYEPETRNPPPNCAIGTGMNITVVDINKDGKVDVVVSGKSGLYLFENRGVPPTKKMR